MENPLMTGGGGGEQKIVKSNGNNNSVGAKSSLPKIIEMKINGRVNPCNRDVKRPTKSRRLVNSKSSCLTTHEVMSFNDDAGILSSLILLSWGFLLKRMHVEGSMMANFPTHKLLENKLSDGTLLSSPHASVLALPNSHKPKGPLYYIKAADNGVVLYGWFDLDRRSFNDVTEYFICNPITKQWLVIPDPKHCTRRASFLNIAPDEPALGLLHKLMKREF
ncbi:hypothetical protein ACH5RR_038118 [Cinchona calisaya]|uniref:Uncharacterized protein n=1 Tax=Cinchona calisaya TaxID=153742 RepID=A0ABD2Y850_9GENT